MMSAPSALMMLPIDRSFKKLRFLMIDRISGHSYYQHRQLTLTTAAPRLAGNMLKAES